MLQDAARQALIQDECSLSYFVFADNFSELSLLLQTIEDLISKEETEEVDRLAGFADALPVERRSEYWAENHPYWWEHVIAPQFRASFLITLMGATEFHLGMLARDGATIVRSPIGPEDMKGGFYQRTRRFLSLFCNFDSPSAAVWERIGDLYAVRNALVHAGGFIRDNEGGRVRAFAGRVQGLRVTSDRIEMDRAFCQLALNECRGFLMEVWQELVLLCRRA
jgi:hypothetical protein